MEDKYVIKALADLISQERSGRNLMYRAQFDGMNAVLTYLSQNFCQGEVCEVNPVAVCMALEPTVRGLENK
jgi:hypothetical protein